MESKELNIGRAGEYLVLSDLLTKGYQCFDSAQGVGYDLVMDIDGILIRVQVKTTAQKKQWDKGIYAGKTSPSYHFHTKRCGRKSRKYRTEDDFELYAFAMLDIKAISYLPNRNLPLASLTLRDRNTKYSPLGGRHGNILYLQDLTIEKALESLCISKKS